MKVIIDNGVTVVKTGDPNGGVKNKHNKTGVSQHVVSDGGVKYRAEIQINKKKYYLGIRDTAEEAGQLRQEADEQLEAGTFFEWFETLKNNAVFNQNGKKGIERRKRANGEYSYKALITINGKKYQIGTRRTLEEAVKLREEAEKHVKNGTFFEWFQSIRQKTK